MEWKRPSLRALLLYPKFPSSYWSLEFLCSLDGRKALTSPLGLITVGALLPSEWHLKLVDENVKSLTEGDWDWAEVVFLSAQIIQRQRLGELIRQAKERGKTVVVGGPYPTISPEEMLVAGADIVVRGELENLAASLLEALERGHTGVILESAQKPDLATSPVPRFDLLRLQDYLSFSLQTSRGCPFDCEFCDVVRIFGRNPRHKTPEQVLAELEALYRLGWRDEIFVSDDNFIGNKSYARDLLQRMIAWQNSHGGPFGFFTQASVDLGQNRELIDLMTAANFSAVIIGIESPDEEVLRSTHKHHNVRHPLVESINAITANGLAVMGSFILGLDHEPPGTGERIAELVEATNMPHVALNLLEPFPHTRLWDRLKREGRLREDRQRDYSRDADIFGGRLAYRPTRPEAEILFEYRRLWERLFDRVNFLSRTYRYYLSMRPTRRALALARGEAPPPTSGPKPTSLREKFRNLICFLRLSWRMGVKPPSRLQYWSQLLGMRRRHPSRFIRYFETLAVAEDMFALREEVLRRLEAFRDYDQSGVE